MASAASMRGLAEVLRHQEVGDLEIALVHRIGLAVVDVVAVEVVALLRHPPRPGKAVGVDGVHEDRRRVARAGRRRRRSPASRPGSPSRNSPPRRGCWRSSRRPARRRRGRAAPRRSRALRPAVPWSDCRSDRSWRRRRAPPPGTCRAPRCSRRRRNGCWPWCDTQVRRVRPPSTTSSCPVMKSASSDASSSAPRAISIGWPEPAQGRLLLPHRADLRIVEVGARHAGIDGAGTDIVGGDVELAELERQRARQPADARLGGAVGGEPVVGVESHHRGGVDDARPALLPGPRLQRRDGLAAQAEHGRAH